MKNKLTLLLCFALALCPIVGLGEGVTLTTATTFAGYDFASQSYSDALEAWETETGFVVDDYSGLPDDDWNNSINQMITAGNLDLYYSSVQLSDAIKDKFVSVDEITQAYPALALTSYPQLAADDGKVYAIPTRLSWEALYINTDVLIEHSLEVPKTWDELLNVINVLSAAGVTPIANSLVDWPSALIDCALLSAGTADEYLGAFNANQGVPQNVTASMDLIAELQQKGAFGTQALTWLEADAETAFINHEAAMRIDGEWLAQNIAQEQWNNTVVITLPKRDGSADATAIVGSAPSGFFITRSAWDDTARRDAVVSLLTKLLSDPVASQLSLGVDDALNTSINEMIAGVTTLCPALMDIESLDYEAYDAWVLAIGDIASGKTQAATVLEGVFK